MDMILLIDSPKDIMPICLNESDESKGNIFKIKERLYLLTY